MNVTESDSHYHDLEKMAVKQLLEIINKEDKTVPYAIEKVIPEIEKLIEATADKLLQGGRLFYLGAGTSGRLAIVDASECPPTFGVPFGLVVGVIAGGEEAIKKPIEFAEDDYAQGWKDLQLHNISSKDVVIGLSASGQAPYVLGGVSEARKAGLVTGGISCNPDTPLSAAVDFPVEVVVGPEVITGSTRMKAGTAQKLILNMISTAVMIRLGRVKDNKMVDMMLSNNKLKERGTRILMNELGINKQEAEDLLKQHGSIRKVLQTREKN